MQHEPIREEYDSFVIPADQEDVEDAPPGQNIQLVEKDGQRQLVGYAVVWGAISSPRKDGFRHRFQKGSITWASPSYALWDHDEKTPLASTTAVNKLVIEEDDYGAKVTIDLDNTTDGDNAFERVKNRLVTGMSFGGYRLAYDRTDDPKVIDVTSFRGVEVSPTINPAMRETQIVTAANADTIQKNPVAQKDSSYGVQKNQLQRLRLQMLKPGR